MIKNKITTTALVAVLALGTLSCKDQLDVGNPNSPAASPTSEAGMIQLASGGVYINGFLNGDGWLGNSYFSLPMGYNELLADNVGASASNNQVTTIAQPEYIIDDLGAKKSNTSATTGILRTYNTRASTGGGNNAVHYQWLNMYSMNSAMNLSLTLIDGIPYATNGADKAKALKAWCYFWKGYAYSSIGTKYIAGLIVNDYVLENGTPVTNNNYVSHDAIIAEANKYFDLAVTTAESAAAGTFATIWGQLLPGMTLTGRGGVLTAAHLKRHVNTMKARNLLYNKLAPYVNGAFGGTITGSSMSGAMSAADWTAAITLLEGGIAKADPIFTGRTVGNANDFFSAGGGTVNSLTANPAKTSTFKPSERSIQNFKPGDLRFERNFQQADAYSNDYVYGVRYSLLDHDLVDEEEEDEALAGTWIYANKGAGAFELVVASSWEENALMLSEAYIRTGKVAEGAALIDQVRDFMGAGIAHINPVGLTATAAMKELSMEKRVAMLYRGISFYDHRRWGWTYDIANGGGSYGNTVVIGAQINTNVTINYDFMDYWDVPANEIVLNPASGSSAPVKNPNFN